MRIHVPKISVDEWFDFIDGCADAGTRQRVQSVIDSHEASRRIFEALRQSDQQLRQEALRLHGSVAVPLVDVKNACARVTHRLKREERETALARERLARCEEMLAPWCGRRVAAGLILAAVARASANSPDALWPAFLVQAESLAASLCGTAAARLLAEFGRSLT